MGLGVARLPRLEGSGGSVLRTLAPSRPGTRVCRFCTAALPGRRPLGAREQAREAGRLSVLSIALKRSEADPDIGGCFNCQLPPRPRLNYPPLGSEGSTC